MFIDPTAPVQPNQFLVEFQDFLDFLMDNRPRRILEIGIDEGGTLYQWIKLVGRGGTVCGIDLPNGPWGSQKTRNVLSWREWAREFGVNLNFMLADSHRPESVAWARRFAPVDMVFIDGDHSYEGVRNDFVNYGQLVRQGGIVALHDIYYHPSDPSIGVHILWDELKKTHMTIEFSSMKEQVERGIGACLF